MIPREILASPAPLYASRRPRSCALCGRLKRTFPAGAPVGAPDLIEANIGIKYSLEGVPEDEQHHWTAWWDMVRIISQSMGVALSWRCVSAPTNVGAGTARLRRVARQHGRAQRPPGRVRKGQDRRPDQSVQGEQRRGDPRLPVAKPAAARARGGRPRGGADRRTAARRCGEPRARSVRTDVVALAANGMRFTEHSFECSLTSGMPNETAAHTHTASTRSHTARS
eukprot:468963-Prymnesium_polylepis.1